MFNLFKTKKALLAELKRTQIDLKTEEERCETWKLTLINGGRRFEELIVSYEEAKKTLADVEERLAIQTKLNMLLKSNNL